MADAFRPEGPTRSVLVGVGLTILAVVVANLLITPLAIAEPGLVDPDRPADRGAVIAMMVLNFAAFAIAGAIYLAATDRGWSFVDLRVPTAADALWIVVTTVGSIAFILAFGALVQVLDLPQAPNDVVRTIGDDRVLLFAMFAIVVLANAPAEEFLFRNVIQKRLYEGFSTAGAIVVASCIFALTHVPSFLVEGVDPVAAAVSLFAVFCGSLVFGYAYARTENLVVPTAAHAGFNLFQFGILYLQLEYGDPGDVEELSTLVEIGVASVPI